MIYAISKELNEVFRVVETLILPVPPEQVELTRCLFCSYERRPLDKELGDLSNTAKNCISCIFDKSIAPMAMHSLALPICRFVLASRLQSHPMKRVPCFLTSRNRMQFILIYK